MSADRVLRGVLAQLVFHVLFLGVGLYLLDVESDVVVIYEFFAVQDLTVKNSTDGNHLSYAGTHYDEASFKAVFFNYALISSGIMLLPGILSAVQSLLLGRMDFGLGSPMLLRRWWHWTLMPCYLAVMSVWWPIVPVIKYLKVAKHLIDEYTGLCDYDPQILQDVVDAKQMEGLCEATLQLAMQTSILLSSNIDKAMYESYFPVPRGLLRFISHILIPSSIISICKMVVGSQSSQVYKVGRLRELSWSYYASYFVWCAWQVLVKLVVFPRLMTDGFRVDHILTFDVAVIAAAFVTADLFLRLDTFGWYDLLPLHSLLSIILPVNFLTPDKAATRHYLVCYPAAQFAIMYCIIIGFSLSHHVQDMLFKLLLGCNCLLGINILLMTVFVTSGLDPMYELKDVAHPSKGNLEVRIETFPSGMLRNTPWIKRLAEKGHFYSHVRLLKMETTCYQCGTTVRHWERLGALHRNPCSLNIEAQESCESEVLIERQCQEEDSRTSQNFQNQEAMLWQPGSWSLLLDLPCAGVTMLTFYLIPTDPRDAYANFKPQFFLFVTTLSLLGNLFLSFHFARSPVCLKELFMTTFVQAFTWRSPHVPSLLKLASFSYLPNAALMCLSWAVMLDERAVHSLATPYCGRPSADPYMCDFYDESTLSTE